MKTTLNIDDTVMRQLKREATRQGRTMSELVETALRLLFQSQKNPQDLKRRERFIFRSPAVEFCVQYRTSFYRAQQSADITCNIFIRIVR
jgi:ribbon-helix-helix CopG family protein